MQAGDKKNRVLVTGGTGYVGSRLIPALQSAGYPVRCLTRHPERLRAFQDGSAEIVAGDVLKPQSIRSACAGVHTAFYLIHSMGAAGNFEQQDRRAARNFLAAAGASGVKRIIYLGGLGAGGNLSPHLRSRQEVGQIFRQSGILSIEFRASIIIGYESISFEMIRGLVEKLPIMVTPRWVRTQAQPIAVQDVLNYLVQAIEMPLTESKMFEIGGPDRLSYHHIMKEYARQRGLKRIMIPVPVLTPYLSSLWLRWVTPLYVRIGKRLIQGIKNATVVSDTSALHYFSVRPCTLEDAIRQALDDEEKDFLNFRAQAGCSQIPAAPFLHHRRLRGLRIYDSYSAYVQCSPEAAFRLIGRMGDKTGWYDANGLWNVRKFIDRLIGGVGFRKSSGNPGDLKAGDSIDFWRVEIHEPNRLLRLKAEMKLPGSAWLQFEVHPRHKGSILFQTTVFKPLGLTGRMYWYLLYPVHALLFRGMIKKIVKKANDERDCISASVV